MYAVNLSVESRLGAVVHFFPDAKSPFPTYVQKYTHDQNISFFTLVLREQSLCFLLEGFFPKLGCVCIIHRHIFYMGKYGIRKSDVLIFLEFGYTKWI